MPTLPGGNDCSSLSKFPYHHYHHKCECLIPPPFPNPNQLHSSLCCCLEWTNQGCSLSKQMVQGQWKWNSERVFTTLWNQWGPDSLLTAPHSHPPRPTCAKMSAAYLRFSMKVASIWSATASRSAPRGICPAMMWILQAQR